jgi:hypothetical protein
MSPGFAGCDVPADRRQRMGRQQDAARSIIFEEPSSEPRFAPAIGLLRLCVSRTKGRGA